MNTVLDTLAAAVAATDRLDWRIYWCEETEQWEAWFHPEWDADPEAVVRVVLADDEPTKNEFACMAALQHMLRHAPALLAVAQAAQRLASGPDSVAWDGLYAALAPLTRETP